jgi:hypothetical protein
MVQGALGSGIRCAVDALDESKLWIALAPVTWTKNDDALQTAHDAFHSVSSAKAGSPKASKP